MKIWQIYNEATGPVIVNNIDLTFSVNVPTLITGVNLFTYVDTAASVTKRSVPCEFVMSSANTLNKKMNDSPVYVNGTELETIRLFFTEGMNFQPIELLLLPGIAFSINTEAFANVVGGDVIRSVLSIQYDELGLSVDLEK